MHDTTLIEDQHKDRYPGPRVRRAYVGSPAGRLPSGGGDGGNRTRIEAIVMGTAGRPSLNRVSTPAWPELRRRASRAWPRTSAAKARPEPSRRACLIIKASRKAHHPAFEAFQAESLDNPIALRHVLLGFLMSDTGRGDHATTLDFNTIERVDRMD